MPFIETKKGKKILRKPESLWVLPYRYDSTLNDYVLGQTVYDLSAIIGDSITIEQGEGETQTKVNEFTNDPLVKNVTSGEWKVTAQCLDLQNNVFKALFASYFNDDANIVAMRGDYDTFYALIRVRFSDTDIPDVYMPKVQMNGKLMIQQLRSRGSQGNLVGTAMSRMCAVVQSQPSTLEDGTLHGVTDIISGSMFYGISTPVMFVPRDSRVLILNHRDNDEGITVFDEIVLNPSPTLDCCLHNRIVSDDSPSKYSIM